MGHGTKFSHQVESASQGSESLRLRASLLQALTHHLPFYSTSLAKPHRVRLTAITQPHTSQLLILSVRQDLILIHSNVS